MAAPLARPHAADGSFGAGRPDYLLCGPFLPYGFRATGARGRVMRHRPSGNCAPTAGVNAFWSKNSSEHGPVGFEAAGYPKIACRVSGPSAVFSCSGVRCPFL